MTQKKTWQLQDAKAHFSEIVNLAELGNSIKITRRGEEVAVLISKKNFDKLTKKKESLLNCFLSAPFPDLDLRLERSKELPRDIDL